MEGCGERVEVCGRGGVVWEVWRGVVRGWKCVGGVEVCGRVGGVWWEGWRGVVRGWRCVGGVERCGSGGGVWLVGGGVW